MVKILFNLLYSTKARKWNLYIDTVRNSLPWFLAYDWPNYFLYLKTHYYELLVLETNFPEISEKLQNGNFPIQMSSGKPFGRMEADNVIETTKNRDTKTPGGTTGMFHSLKNQNTLRCRNYFVEEIFGKFFLYIFF